MEVGLSSASPAPVLGIWSAEMPVGRGNPASGNAASSVGGYGTSVGFCASARFFIQFAGAFCSLRESLTRKAFIAPTTIVHKSNCCEHWRTYDVLNKTV